jgi:hypothetical protein
MKKALKTIGLIFTIAVALGIDVAVLIGYLPISAAAFIALATAIIATNIKPSDLNIGTHLFLNKAQASCAATKGESYVITGKSFPNNSRQFK